MSAEALITAGIYITDPDFVPFSPVDPTPGTLRVKFGMEWIPGGSEIRPETLRELTAAHAIPWRYTLGIGMLSTGPCRRCSDLRLVR